MRFTFSFAFFLVFSTILLSACGGKNDPTPVSPTTLLASKTWRYFKATVDGQDVTATAQTSCFWDDGYSFRADGTYIIYVGQNKCISGQTNQTGTWSFSSDGRKIIIMEAGDPTTCDISVSGSQLTLGQTASNGRYVIMYFR